MLVVMLVLPLVVAPGTVDAQQATKVWRIGFISVAHTKVEDVLFQQLRDLGYVEGQNLIVERRYSEGRAEQFAELAAALVRLGPDLIVVTTTPAALAAKKATTTIRCSTETRRSSSSPRSASRACSTGEVSSSRPAA